MSDVSFRLTLFLELFFAGLPDVDMVGEKETDDFFWPFEVGSAALARLDGVASGEEVILLFSAVL